MFKSLIYSILIALVLSSCGKGSVDPNEEEWLAIFDGNNLSDWTPKLVGEVAGADERGLFRVADSILSIRYPKADTFMGKFGHLFYKEPFSHYKLRATYRFVGEQIKGAPAWAFRNNGLMLHCQSPQSMGIDQNFPSSLEMQLLGGDGKAERPTGNLCTPGTHVVMGDTLFTPHCISSTSSTFHGDQWVTIEALVLGDSLIQHIVDNQVVMEYSKPTINGYAIENYDSTYIKEGAALKEGYISIQAESHPTDFKSIEVLNLCGCMDKDAKNYKSYYVKADNSKCLYN